MGVDLLFESDAPTSGQLYFYVSGETNGGVRGYDVALDGYWPTLPPKPEPGAAGIDE